MRTKSLTQRVVWFAVALPLLWPVVFHAPIFQAGTEARSASEPAVQDPISQRKAREKMVRQQIAARGVRDARVLDALRKVPRHLFVPMVMQPHAYQDTPLPIGYAQTISQPYVVGFMTEALKLRPQDRVLEIGTGSGYQAAVLSLLVQDVYSIEIVEPLGREAAERLQRLGYANVKVRIGDGYKGWPEAAPFDAIIVTAAPGHIPQPLLDQLAPGGRLLVPVGKDVQTLVRVRRTAKGFKPEELLGVRFVPMTGEAEKK
ncbi:MAG: protein-L-isoaspartate(D-aspartate) O-methyltransferase [Acidobacteria bacterium]|nr:protein-L-isoaspartate(D-aspartate) O-methyltransferase [Acidobacteriota bacterium]